MAKSNHINNHSFSNFLFKSLQAQQSLERLIEGNLRFANGEMLYPSQDSRRRSEVLSSQSPLAVILSCSDSRVPPEILFDQGIGDLFIIRTAGNVLDDIALGSIEYAVEHLHTPLIIVLGHRNCNVVSMAIQGDETEGYLSDIITQIKPALEGLEGEGEELINQAVEANIRYVVNQLVASQPVLAEAIEHGELMVTGANYDLETGEVLFFEQH